MALRFERRQKEVRYLDSRAAFAEAAIACEIRRDPLTGGSGRVAPVLGFQAQPVAFDPHGKASCVGCPVCPARVCAVTPRFPEEVSPAGHIIRGESVLVPNLAPYDEHSAVAVMSRAQLCAK